MKKKLAKLPKPMLMTNAVEPAAPASVWGKGCAGKGGKTLNSRIADTENKQSKESE